MKPGVTLIELVVAMMIASMMAISLFQVITQTRRAVSRISAVIEVDQNFMGFYNQVEKDVMGMFAPISSIQSYQQRDIKAQKEKSSGREQGAQQGQQTPPNEPPPKAAEKDVKKEATRSSIENVFFLDSQQDRFFLSFITTGAINLLESDGTIQPQPSMRRVAYVLEKDPQRPSVYRLMYRFSNESLDVSSIKASSFYPSYELLSGITHFEIELTVFETEKKEGATQAKDASAKKQQVPKEEKSEKSVKKAQTAALKEWNEGNIWEKYKTLIPAYVRIKGAVADRSGRAYPFECTMKVIAYNPLTETPPEKTLAQEIEELAQGIFGKGGVKR